MPEPYAVPLLDAQAAMEGVMKNYNFTIIASGLDGDADEVANRLYEAGCDDATVSCQKGLLVLEFDREARTFVAALVTAMRDVLESGAKIERIEPDYLVSAAEIARRSGVTRSAISQYATQRRGRDFPPPVARVTSETPLWDWFEVASWMHRQQTVGLDAVVHARTVREANQAIMVDQPTHLVTRLTRRPRKREIEGA